jgi:hypothetical protein
MATYESQRHKIKMYIDGAISRILLKDPNSIIQYHKFISFIATELGVTQSIVTEVLESYFENKKLIEVREILINRSILEKKDKQTEEDLSFLK